MKDGVYIDRSGVGSRCSVASMLLKSLLRIIEKSIS
jgi:hypothetical protein